MSLMRSTSVLLAVLYITSILYIAVRVARYKRPIRLHGGFDYGYLEDQTFHTRTAIAVALNTSILSLALNFLERSPAFTLILGTTCPLISVALLKTSKVKS